MVQAFRCLEDSLVASDFLGISACYAQGSETSGQLQHSSGLVDLGVGVEDIGPCIGWNSHTISWKASAV